MFNGNTVQKSGNQKHLGLTLGEKITFNDHIISKLTNINKIHKLLYFNFEPGFKPRWCRARDLFESQIPVATGGFELRISCIRSSYLTRQVIKSNRLGGFGVPAFAILRQE